MKMLSSITLKNHPRYNEKWLQSEIAKNPSILGLGPLDFLTKEKIQPSGGRLDLLFQDTEQGKRYEVELQLGQMDESHIIRTIEYWDIERKRYPQFDHTAVLVAEDVSSRFLNVVQLFNGHIPLIVKKLSALEVDGDIALIFTTVLDEIELGLPDDDIQSEPTDRNYWEKRTSQKIMGIVDDLFAVIVSVDAEAKINYNKYYVGILRDKSARNYCLMCPKKSLVPFCCKHIPSDDLIQEAENAGIDVEKKVKWNEVWLRFTARPTADQVVILKKFIEFSKNAYGV